MDPLDIAIQPHHQAVAARLGLAAVDESNDRTGKGLAEVAALGIPDALAVIAVLSHNLANALTGTVGVDAARKMFERTILVAGEAQ